MPEQPRLSIVVPVLNESDCLDQSLQQLYADPWLREHAEVLLSDGGSDDGSLEIAARYPCRILRGPAGRALQMNAGAAQARGDYLLFLHADSRLPAELEAIADGDADWGFFRLRLSGDSPAFRFIETAINLRTRLSRVAGGDQGLFFSRQCFEALGGFPPIPLMEDIAICKLARRRSAPRIVAAHITSSSRRWQRRGIFRTVLLMWWLRLAYWLGADPQRLHRIYYPQRG